MSDRFGPRNRPGSSPASFIRRVCLDCCACATMLSGHATAAPTNCCAATGHLGRTQVSVQGRTTQPLPPPQNPCPWFHRFLPRAVDQPPITLCANGGEQLQQGACTELLALTIVPDQSSASVAPYSLSFMRAKSY